MSFQIIFSKRNIRHLLVKNIIFNKCKNVKFLDLLILKASIIVAKIQEPNEIFNGNKLWRGKNPS